MIKQDWFLQDHSLDWVRVVTGITPGTGGIGGGGNGTPTPGTGGDENIFSSADPQATADNEHKAIFDTVNDEWKKVVGHGHIGRMIGWERLPVGTVFETGKEYAGTINDTPYPAGSSPGDVYFIREGQHWVELEAGGHGQPYTPPNYINDFAYQADAENAVSTVGDIVAMNWDGDSTSKLFPYMVTSYTAAQMAERRLQTIGPGPEQLLPKPPPVRGYILETDDEGGYELVRALTLDDFLPHVDRLPTATTTSPENLIVSHEYTEGNRQDAVLTVGFDGNFAGYKSERIADVGVGSINRVSPMEQLFGVGSSSDYLEDLIYSFNETFINDINRVYISGISYVLGDTIREGSFFIKRILNPPTGLSAATLAINFRRADDSWYFTDGISAVHRAGEYQKEDIEGVLSYQPFVTLGIAHIDSVGAPNRNPTRPGQIAIDDLGRVWSGGGNYINVITGATGTDEAFTHTGFVQTFATRDELFQLGGGNGAFGSIQQVSTNSWVQIQGPNVGDYRDSLIWHNVWNYRAEHVDTIGAANATAIRYRDEGVFLGGFHSLQGAVDELFNVLTSTGDAFELDKYFYTHIGGTNAGVRRITSLTGGVATRSDNFFWKGPHFDGDDVAGWVANHGSLLAESLDTFITNDTWRTGNSIAAFHSLMQDQSAILSSSFTSANNVLHILPSDVDFNVGGFILETASSLTKIVLPEDGIYELNSHVYVPSSTARTLVVTRFVIEHADGTLDYEASFATLYLRGAQGITEGTVVDTTFINAVAGDKIWLQFYNNAGSSLNITGASSDVSIAKKGGLTGPRGLAGIQARNNIYDRSITWDETILDETDIDLIVPTHFVSTSDYEIYVDGTYHITGSTTVRGSTTKIIPGNKFSIHTIVFNCDEVVVGSSGYIPQLTVRLNAALNRIVVKTSTINPVTPAGYSLVFNIRIIEIPRV